MGTVVHKNLRGQQPQRVVTSGDPRAAPAPEVKPKPKPKKKLLDKTERRRATTMQRRHYPHGFGLFSCGNCRNYHRKYKEVTGRGGCEAAGVKRTDRPCCLNSHGFGYFEPTVIPDVVKEIVLKNLTRDQLLLLEYRVRQQEISTFHNNMAMFPIGVDVKVLLHGRYQYGTVIRLLKRTVRIEMHETGKVMAFRPEDLELSGDPLG
jgi:hypothetical protein